MFDFLNREKRATTIPAGAVSVSDPRIAEIFGGWLGGMDSASGVTVNTETALGVPSIWAAVNFISGTLAGLPLKVYRKRGDDREAVRGGLTNLLHDAVNDETSSFEWRKHAFEQVLTGGRSFTYIERNPSGAVAALWPLDPTAMTVDMPAGQTARRYRYGSKRSTVTYEAREIIDIPFMLKPDRIGHRSPLTTNRDVIGLAIAATEYGSKFFQGGGVPPFAVTGNFQSTGALSRAADDLAEAVRKAAKEQRQALTLPNGLEIKPIGADPEKSQLVELKRFIIEEVARIYSIPPTFLQDLTHGTFSNTEQQDLHFVKHTIKRWAEQFEQELNLKLFGRRSNTQYAELNMDGLLRGDFKTRMDGYAQGIQNGILTPNEARRQENRPSMGNGDDLLIQGATVPLGSQPMNQPPAEPNGEE
jgi:HK97 family phage portal protein